ncbi:transposon Ty3-I Gag-Pol polyprotein [Trichonephila clavipes]|nr:transposon Ty3-I Gag-Pol polyprotein [Trichonephila clavipes]
MFSSYPECWIRSCNTSRNQIDASRLNLLLHNLQLGDKRPSHLLSEMRNLAPSKLEDDLLQTLWLQRLPANLQQVLSVCKAPLDELTQIADKVHEVSGSDLTIARIETKSNQIELDVLKAEMANLKNMGTVKQVQSLGLTLVENNSPYNSILSKYTKWFSTNLQPSTNESSVFHCIETKGPPVHARTRRLNPERLAYLKRQFGDLMRQGIIRPSKSSYASPIHFVKKSDGSWRICGDFRRLNSVTIPDRYPLPHIHDFVSGLRGKLGEHGIIVNPQKCAFGQSELKFLGFLVSSNGISPLPEKIQFLKDFPLPKTVQELRRFLATLNFYHFLKGAAEEQACLHDLVKNKVKRDNTPVVWNDVTKSAFESYFAVGSVLQQHIETTVEPLGFFSRKLSATEKEYSTFDQFLKLTYLNSNDYSRLSEDQSSDLELQSLMGSATGLELRPMYFAHADKPFYCDVSMGTVRPYDTKQFRRQIFNQLHNLSHPGVKATQKLNSARFVWKNLNKDCALWCKSCTQCQRSKVSRHTKSPVGTFPLPSARFSNVHIDVVGPLSPVRGMSYLLTCVDRFTRWPEVFPIPDQTADTIARTFLLGWIARFGVPERITSDRGTNFQSNLFSSLSKF